MSELNIKLAIPMKDNVPSSEGPSEELMEFHDNLDGQSSLMFAKIDQEITKWMGNKFGNLQSNSLETSSSLTVSSEPIVISSQSSFVIPSPPQETISEISEYMSVPYKILNINDPLPRNVYYAQEKN